MTHPHSRYVAIETCISIVINVAITVGFYFLVFGGQAEVARYPLILDAIPQSFMIALMSTVVPTLLTRRRIAAGAIARGIVNRAFKLPRRLPVRAVAIGVGSVLVGIAINALVLTSLFPPSIDFTTGLWWKMLFGALLSLGVTPLILRSALADP